MKRLLIALCLIVSLLGLIIPNAAAQDDTSSAANRCLETPNDNGCRAGLPAGHYQMLLDKMTLLPTPDVRPLPVNQGEITRYAYRRLTNPDGTTYYNAPGGAPIGSIAAGFTYVKIINRQDGWVEIDPGQWVPEDQTAVTRPSVFGGVLFDEDGLEYPMAWVLIPSYPSAFPGSNGDDSRPRLERYTRVSIFDTVEVDGWQWYLVGPDTWIIQTSVAKVLFTDKPEGVKGRWVAVDLYEQVLVAYDEDTPVYATLISSGLGDWPTREGLFQTYWRLTLGYMTGAEGQSDYYLVDGVPWTMYFDDSISLHGTYWHDGFGYRHSHGCVNMTITDAHWLYQWTLDGGFDYPYVYVYSSGEYVNG